MTAVIVVQSVAILVLAILVLGLLRSHALILRALHELGAGLQLEKEAQQDSPGPVPVELERGVVPHVDRPTLRVTEVVGHSLDGTERTVPLGPGSGRTLLAFLTSGCSVCHTFWETFREPGLTVPGDGRLAVIAKRPEEDSTSTLARLAADTIQVTQSSAAWTDLAVPGSPYFVYVEDGVIVGEGSATSWSQVSDLMQQGIDDAHAAQRDRGAPVSVPEQGPAGAHVEDRDSLSLIDAELLQAGIRPGHPSLYRSPDEPE